MNGVSIETPVFSQSAPNLTIVVPTYNERDNIPILIEKITHALEGKDWEVLFVDDDSPDGTSGQIRAIGEKDRRVRGIRRIGRRGLAGACIEGILSSQANYIAVMDADLQHDETLLTAMLERMESSDIDLVVASRYIEGGSSSSFSYIRSRISRWANSLAQHFLNIELSDPMSGFFMIRRSIVEDIAPSLTSQGYKILLDIVATAKGKLRVAEIPFSFRSRLHGESKLDTSIAFDFASLIVGKLTYDLISLRFILFGLVGLTGLGLHLVFLKFGILNGLQFELAQGLSTTIIIAWNFMLNNMLTYRDKRLKGIHFITGLIRFEIICAVGVISNVGVASWIYSNDSRWWIAGIGGALMGVMWNYLVSAAYVWKTR